MAIANPRPTAPSHLCLETSKGNAIRLFIGRRHPRGRKRSLALGKSDHFDPLPKGMFLVLPAAASKPPAVNPQKPGEPKTLRTLGYGAAALSASARPLLPAGRQTRALDG